MIAGLDLNFTIELILLTMLIGLAVAIASTRKLLAAIVLMSIYSLVLAVWLVVMDAPDVAFTEAVVGAGVSTIILLGATLLVRGETEKHDWGRLAVPIVLAMAVGGLLIYAAMGLPDFGNPAAPATTYVGHAYLERAANQTGAANVVTAALASYRGFDTLGETTVIFAAGVGVALLLGFVEPAPVTPAASADDHHVVLRVTARLLIPVIALYALYVQFHAELGPGGGFQAGVILAVAVILHALVFGLGETMKALPPGFVRGSAALGVLIYAGLGVASIVNGGGFLDYGHLLPPDFEAKIPAWLLGPGNHHWGQLTGIFVIELGVLLTVAASMVTLFYSFAARAVATGRRR
jgi:multicomponent Na+:H+ antiporter subunit B